MSGCVSYSAKSGRLEARLSDVSSRRLFDSIAQAIVQHFGGCWIEQLNGFDQRYWDLKINDVVLTLHLEHYMGISLFPAQDAGDLVVANSLVRIIAAFFEGSLASLER